MRVFLYLFVLLGVIVSVHGQIAKFSFNEDSYDTTTIERISGIEIPINNYQQRPPRITGVAQNALRLDGWSTWIHTEAIEFNSVERELSIDLWYATEAYSAANGGLVSQIGGGTGFSLEVDAFGHIIWAFHCDGQFYILVSDEVIDKYKWNHIRTTIDLNDQRATIELNENIIVEQILDTHESITLAEIPLSIGRQSNEILFDQFLISAANGAIDEISIYNNVDESSNIEPQVVNAQLTIDPELRHPNDHLRPRYHAMPNTHWTNECYGLLFYNNEYHLFFQKNPNGPYLNFMHWGHLVSDDLIHWREKKIALSPGEGDFDNAGVWAGASIIGPNGLPRLFYTGVNGRFAGIGSAMPTDDSLSVFVKSDPLFTKVPDIPRSDEWRDPFLWKDQETYYMIIGSGLINQSGGYLWTYKSTDLANWEEIDFLYRDGDSDRSGIFWEVPFFSRLEGNTYILGVTPVPRPGIPARVIYWIGSWENEKFTPYFVDPKEFELLNTRSLAPATGVDRNGNPTYFTIIPEDRDVQDQINAGWRQVFSLPRVMRLINENNLGHIPHPNICLLREDPLLQIQNQIIDAETVNNLNSLIAVQSEIELKLLAQSDDIIRIDLFKHENGNEVTTLSLDMEGNRIILDRTNSTFANAAKDIVAADYNFHPSDSVDLRIFVDHSTIEVFIDQLAVLSSRVYPSRASSNQVDIRSETGNLNLLSLNVWNLQNKESEISSGSPCEIGDLPNGLFSDEIVSSKEVIINGDELISFPNPTPGAITIEVSRDMNQAKLYIIDVHGRQVGVIREGPNDISKLASDLYYVIAESEERILISSIIKL